MDRWFAIFVKIEFMLPVNNAPGLKGSFFLIQETPGSVEAVCFCGVPGFSRETFAVFADAPERLQRAGWAPLSIARAQGLGHAVDSTIELKFEQFDGFRGSITPEPLQDRESAFGVGGMLAGHHGREIIVQVF